MAHIVHGVIVVIIDIIAMMRELGSTIPEVVRHIQVVVIDAGVDDGHHHAFTCITQGPHIVGIHLGDIRRNFARGRGRSGHFPIGDPIALYIITNDLDVIASRKVIDGGFICREAHGIGHPEDTRRGDHAHAFHLGERMAQVVLGGIGELLQFVHHKLTPFRTRREPVGATVQLGAVVLCLHDDDDVDLLIVATACHLFPQKRVDDTLGEAIHAQHRRQ